jgi:hypothetical protein
MFNSAKPSLEELPSTLQLVRSTIIAGFAAVAILVTVILPAEYGIDPTGIGRTLGLAEMGEIKKQLSEEAEADRELEKSNGDQSNLWHNLRGIFISSAFAQDTGNWGDSVTFTLKPGDTAEWKLTMEQNQTVEYQMIVEGGRVNFDLHGHGSGKSTTYEKGRGSKGSEGRLSAKFDGDHGWFWRNRDKVDVTVTIKVRGNYIDFKNKG